MVKLSDSKMPASKKDLKKNQQKKNVAAGIGDAQGRLPSQNKVRGCPIKLGMDRMCVTDLISLSVNLRSVVDSFGYFRGGQSRCTI